MYFVIKRQYVAPMQRFIGFIVSKYIAAKNSDNVIFEFVRDDKVQRKWIKKEDIVLLTKNKEYFIKILNQFKNVEQTQQGLVDEAQSLLNQSIETFTATMDKELEEYISTDHTDDIKVMLND